MRRVRASRGRHCQRPYCSARGVKRTGLTTEIYLVRHGETEWNVEERFQGWHDSPLTERGIAQARSLASALSEIEFHAIYASSSGRTVHTAEIVRGERKVAIRQSDALREIFGGAWEGMTRQEAAAAHPLAHEAYREDPVGYRSPTGGESFHDVLHRVSGFLNEILSLEQGHRVLLVSHTVPVKLLAGRAAGQTLDQLWAPPFIRPASITQISVEDGRERLLKLGDASHWEEAV
jgi:broad specificity phosphatase PhoE